MCQNDSKRITGKFNARSDFSTTVFRVALTNMVGIVTTGSGPRRSRMVFEPVYETVRVFQTKNNNIVTNIGQTRPDVS